MLLYLATTWSVSTLECLFNKKPNIPIMNDKAKPTGSKDKNDRAYLGLSYIISTCVSVWKSL